MLAAWITNWESAARWFASDGARLFVLNVYRKKQDEWYIDNTVVSADRRQFPVEMVG